MASKVKVKLQRLKRPSFRKLGIIDIWFADPLMLIANHGEIGESTILGWVATTAMSPSLQDIIPV